MSVFEDIKQHLNNKKTTTLQGSTPVGTIPISQIRYVVVNAYDEENKFVHCKVVPFSVDKENGTFINYITNKSTARLYPNDAYLLDDISKLITEQVQQASLEDVRYEAKRPFNRATLLRETSYDRLVCTSALEKELKRQGFSPYQTNENDKILVSQELIVDFANISSAVLTRVKLDRQFKKETEKEKQNKKQLRKQNKTKVKERTM